MFHLGTDSNIFHASLWALLRLSCRGAQLVILIGLDSGDTALVRRFWVIPLLFAFFLTCSFPEEVLRDCIDYLCGNKFFIFIKQLAV